MKTQFAIILVSSFAAALAACVDIKIDVNKTAHASDGIDGSRLIRQYIVASDGSKMETNYWFDNELSLTCSFQDLEDNKTYCVPSHVRMNAYSDASCTKPIYVEAYSPNQFACHTFPRFVRFGHDYAQGCGNVIDLGFDMYQIDQDNPIEKGPNVKWFEKDNTKACNPKLVVGTGLDAAIFPVIEIGDESKFVVATSKPTP